MAALGPTLVADRELLMEYITHHICKIELDSQTKIGYRYIDQKRTVQIPVAGWRIAIAGWAELEGYAERPRVDYKATHAGAEPIHVYDGRSLTPCISLLPEAAFKKMQAESPSNLL